ncbi:MAG: undecaprenyldiphospho-muramoylpentapeptide beta-N-acetylglucosaminyltransferase [Firmicutes bacterium]|nr:undecaprenyldiphospho-muramoylpentapeptide beta-N-acetylglucosaminyltransferase [Bacillota bacterium]
MRVMITGGGTGGHIYPALAIAEALRQEYPGCEVVYVGNAQGMEHGLAAEAGYPFVPIHVAGFSERGLLKALAVLRQNVRGVAEAKRELKKFRPDLVVGTGGYACGPLMLAAAKMGIPTLLHEQNAVMGKTNTILSSRVSRICLTFPVAGLKSAAERKSVITGLPVRDAILRADKAKSRRLLGLAADAPVVLLTGGSQGARHLNQAFAGLWRELLAEGVQIIHLCGDKLLDETAALAQQAGLPVAQADSGVPQAEGGFLLLPYLHHMEYALAAADVVIGRAGASFLAELTALGRSAVLVPYPFAAGNHQEHNARALVDAGAATCIADAELSADSLRAALQKPLYDIKLRDEMAAASAAIGRRDAAAAIVQEAARLIG